MIEGHSIGDGIIVAALAGAFDSRIVVAARVGTLAATAAHGRRFAAMAR